MLADEQVDSVVRDVLRQEDPRVGKPDHQLLSGLGIDDRLETESDAIDNLLTGVDDMVYRARPYRLGIVMARRVPVSALDANVPAPVDQVLDRGQGITGRVDVRSPGEVVGMRVGDVEPGYRLSQAGRDAQHLAGVCGRQLRVKKYKLGC